jgi:uncharacterized protein (DUF1499 family)
MPCSLIVVIILSILIVSSSFDLVKISTIRKFPAKFKEVASVAASILLTACAIFPLDALAETDFQPKQQYYGVKKGRLLSCKPMGNCLSTSAVESIEKYGRPWIFTGSADEEYDKLLYIVKNEPYLKLEEASATDKYIHATAKSAVPPTSLDDIEFLINDKENIITYRSNSREVVLIYLQTPVSDGGSNRNRLEAIRQKLGVSEMKIAQENEDYMKDREKMGLFQIIQEASQPNDVNFLDNSVPDKVDDDEDK